MSGSTANAVLVGLTSTDAVNNMPDEFVQMAKGEFIPKQDVPRYGEVGDVTDAISMLCSRESRWVTGQTISVSGGCCKIHLYPEM